MLERGPNSRFGMKSTSDWYGSPSGWSEPYRDPAFTLHFSKGPSRAPLVFSSHFMVRKFRFGKRQAYAVASFCSPIDTPANSASARISVGTGTAASGGASCFGRSLMMDSTLNHSAVVRRRSFWWLARVWRRECPVQSVYGGSARSNLYIDAEIIPGLDLVYSKAPEGAGAGYSAVALLGGHLGV